MTNQKRSDQGGKSNQIRICHESKLMMLAVHYIRVDVLMMMVMRPETRKRNQHIMGFIHGQQ